jgi:hypothetical protein
MVRPSRSVKYANSLAPFIGFGGVAAAVWARFSIVIPDSRVDDILMFDDLL